MKLVSVITFKPYLFFTRQMPKRDENDHFGQNGQFHGSFVAFIFPQVV